jgi:hypothetical protein
MIIIYNLFFLKAVYNSRYTYILHFFGIFETKETIYIIHRIITDYVGEDSKCSNLFMNLFNEGSCLSSSGKEFHSFAPVKAKLEL